MKFYDPKDEGDLARVEALLHKGGIEYSLAAAVEKKGFPVQVMVAEEDVPTAENILLQAATKK